MLEAEWNFYEKNRDELVEKYCGKYVVISEDKVVAVYGDENTTYFEIQKTIPPGSFMIHPVMEEEEVYQILDYDIEEVDMELAQLDGNRNTFRISDVLYQQIFERTGEE